MKDDRAKSLAQSAFGEMVFERFRLVLEEFENEQWVLDSECTWAVLS
jgi:hypothetical protein